MRICASALSLYWIEHTVQIGPVGHPASGRGVGPLPSRCASVHAHLRFTIPCYLLYSTQVPRFLTINDSTLVHVLPLEVTYWWLVRSGVQPAAWVLILSSSAMLVGHLAQRAGVGLNMTWLHPEAPVEPSLEALQPLGDALRREVRVADGIAPVNWGQDVDRVWLRARGQWTGASYALRGGPLCCCDKAVGLAVAVYVANAR